MITLRLLPLELDLLKLEKKIKFNYENLRELIFKGYTIPFFIDEKNYKIILLGIFNQNLWN